MVELAVSAVLNFKYMRCITPTLASVVSSLTLRKQQKFIALVASTSRGSCQEDRETVSPSITDKVCLYFDLRRLKA